MPTIATTEAFIVDNVATSALEQRLYDTAMFAGDGSNNGIRGGIAYHGPTSMGVTVNGSDQVTVQAGAVVIPAGTGLGVWRGTLAAATSAVGLTARNATNPRIDLVVAQATGTTLVIKTIDGTPAASPVAPALPAQHVELARLTVPQVAGGAVTVDSTWRTFATALGGILRVPTVARLPGSGNTLGDQAVAIDTGIQYSWTGAAWVQQGIWIPYTASVINLPLNAGASWARYTKVGRLVTVQFGVTASGAGSGNYQLDLPVLPVVTSPTGVAMSLPIGIAVATDTGTTNVPCVPYMISGGANGRVGFMTTTGSALVGTAVPFTWVSTDLLSGTLTYESAA